MLYLSSLGIEEPAEKVNDQDLIFNYGLLHPESSATLHTVSGKSNRLKASGKGSGKRSSMKTSTKEAGPSISGDKKLASRDPSIVRLSTSGKPTYVNTYHQSSYLYIPDPDPDPDPDTNSDLSHCS